LTLKDVADNVGKAEVSVPAATSAVVNNTTAWPSDSGSTQTIKPITPVTTEYSPPPISPVRSQETNPTPLMTEQRTVASSSMNVPPPQYPPSTGSPYVPQVKLVSQPQVKIEFGVEHLGPSGVGKVDVYLTTNDGQTWEHTATETPIIGPNNEYGQQGGRDSVMVKIPRQEIVYGIFLVVKNGAGVGGPPPRNGQDRPMMRVEVDTRLPDILLYAPKPDPAREGVILLSWKAVDRNLDDYPVTIEYREDPNGPWRLVSNTPSLPNTGALDAYSTGSFAWTVPNIATGLVYLKLTVRDKAGNVSEATTPKPVLIDLSKPVPTNLTVNGGT
jgi:hypothetical protein